MGAIEIFKLQVGYNCNLLGASNLVLSSYKWVAIESELFVYRFKNQIQNLKSFKF
jgi:hypothetical protein